MPIEAKLIVRDPDIPIPIYEVDASVFRLPDARSHWWRETFAATVTSVDEGDPPRITIERDPTASQAFYDGIPEGAEIGANHDPETGTWEVHVEASCGRILGQAHGRDADEDVFDVAARARGEAMSE